MLNTAGPVTISFSNEESMIISQEQSFASLSIQPSNSKETFQRFRDMFKVTEEIIKQKNNYLSIARPNNTPSS